MSGILLLSGILFGNAQNYTCIPPPFERDDINNLIMLFGKACLDGGPGLGLSRCRGPGEVPFIIIIIIIVVFNLRRRLHL